MSFPNFNRCCNPFKELNHSQKKYLKNLRSVSAPILKKLRFLKSSDFLCSYCRIKVYDLAQNVSHVCTDEDASDSDLSQDDDEDDDDDCFSLFEGDDEEEQQFPTQFISELKEKFHQSYVTLQQKMQILTLLPNNWSVNRAAMELNTSRYFIRNARDLKDKDGVLSIPKEKHKPFSNESLVKIREFYERDDISVMMAGQKDKKSMKIDGQKCVRQKRLLIGNLKYCYQKFKEGNPDIKIGLTKFISLRPFYCVLAGSGGTHVVCVCPHHENMKLMITGCHLVQLLKKENFEVNHYEDILLYLLCKNPTEECYFSECKACPTDEKISDLFFGVLKKHKIANITHKQWVTKQRTTRVKKTITAEEFVQNLCKTGRIFMRHSFIAQQQYSFYKHTRKSLKYGEALINCDFAENYAFVIQNSISGFHWNNDQATIFPIVFYYKDEDELKHKTVIIISDCMKHDAAAVYVFLKAFNEYLSENFPQISKCIYFSDGAPQQFKNMKNFCNIYHHEQDFSHSAEWHFHATSHGKGPCDGAGGTIKRMARQASLQMNYDDQITTPLELYEWASKDSELPRISVIYRNSKDYEESEEFLKPRFDKCRAIPGTLSLHCIKPDENFRLRVKTYSFSQKFESVNLLKSARSSHKK